LPLKTALNVQSKGDHMAVVIAPKLDSKSLGNFVSKLDDAITNSELESDSNYEDYLKPHSLPFLEYDRRFPEGNCWHNCYRYVHQTSSEVVFGWLIFEIVNDRFVAQNHAVVRGGNGKFFDPTHCSVIETNGVFVPDLRAKIQYKNLRAVGSFELLKNGSAIWVNEEDESKELLYRPLQDSKQLQDHIDLYVTDI
jgi:hypothetical protein